ncbi:MAG: acyl-CoA dehydrogenase family protein [Jiangellales bacterium]
MLTDPFATPERRALRDTVHAFMVRDVLPHLDEWEEHEEIPRRLHRTASAAGLLGVGFDESVGGSGGSALDSLVVTEQIMLSGGSGGLLAGLLTHGIALPHIVAAGDRAQIDRFVRPVLAGEAVAALAVTEPDGGSDVAAVRTRATRDGDAYVVNGVKTYITSGMRADHVTTVVRTGGDGHGGLSLLVVPTDAPGVSRRPLAKMGWQCSDTAEVAFTDVRVPAANLVGAEGSGFVQVATQFVDERIALAVQAYATAQRCLDLTVAWVRARETFGRPLASRQVVRHRLVEMHRQIDVARTYTRQVVLRHVAGDEVVAQAAMAKNTAVATCDHVVDEAVQLHGGLGYMRGTEVERHYRDARILGIGGGASEVMTELVAARLGW